MKRIADKAGKVLGGFQEVEHAVSEADGVRLDGKGFFVIHVDGRSKRIVVEHYSYDRKVKDKFSGASAKGLCDTIIRKGLVGDASHAAYLGRELMKAEVCLKKDLKYVQDRSISFK
ncbi:MAG: DUF4346 domain-containing protein [Candidatus Altiarchaeota archaeon]